MYKSQGRTRRVYVYFWSNYHSPLLTPVLLLWSRAYHFHTTYFKYHEQKDVFLMSPCLKSGDIMILFHPLFYYYVTLIYMCYCVDVSLMYILVHTPFTQMVNCKKLAT